MGGILKINNTLSWADSLGRGLLSLGMGLIPVLVGSFARLQKKKQAIWTWSFAFVMMIGVIPFIIMLCS